MKKPGFCKSRIVAFTNLSHQILLTQMYPFFSPQASELMRIERPAPEPQEWNRWLCFHLIILAFFKWAKVASSDLWIVLWHARRHDTLRLILDGLPMKSSSIWHIQTRGDMQKPANFTWSNIRKKISWRRWRFGMNGKSGLPIWKAL